MIERDEILEMLKEDYSDGNWESLIDKFADIVGSTLKSRYPFNSTYRPYLPYDLPLAYISLEFILTPLSAIIDLPTIYSFSWARLIPPIIRFFGGMGFHPSNVL